MNEHSSPPRETTSPAHPDAGFRRVNRHGASDACASCHNSERRRFVQAAVAGVVTLLGLSVADTATAAEIVAAVAPPPGMRGDTTYAIPAADGVNIDTNNDVIIARSAGRVYAFALACPHQNTMLRWSAKDHRFQCPKHKSRYSPEGEFQSGRATRNMDRLAIRQDGTSVIVDSSREIRSDQNPAAWAAAVVHLSP